MPKTKEKRVLHHKYFCTDRLGETDAFFEVVDKNLVFISAWSHNDAMWRGEYMSGLLSYLGVTVKDLPNKYEKKAEGLVCEAFGL